MHPRLVRVLRERGIAASDFDAACRRACDAAGVPGPISTRMKVSAAMMAVPGGRVCDVGGGPALYPIVALFLGSDVTIVDDLRGWDDAVRRRIEAFAELGARYVEADIEALPLAPETYDAVVAYETIEHLPNSPRPALEKMAGALKPGGRLCLSVPNIARIDQRLRLLRGRSPHESVKHFFREGTPFFGHHREYTLGELAWMAGELGLDEIRTFGLNVTYESLKTKTPAQKLLLRLDEEFGLGDRVLPHTLRHHAWLQARKPATARR